MTRRTLVGNLIGWMGVPVLLVGSKPFLDSIETSEDVDNYFEFTEGDIVLSPFDSGPDPMIITDKHIDFSTGERSYSLRYVYDGGWPREYLCECRYITDCLHKWKSIPTRPAC